MTTIAASPALAAGDKTSSPTPQQVLAVVSPVAYPACSAAGLSTLLVPVVSNLLSTDLHLKSVSVGDLVLNSLGPVFVVCGELPAPKGSRCSLVDSSIVQLWPSELNTFGIAPLAPLGSVVDSIDALLALLGLPPTDAVDSALKCSVPPPEKAPKPVGARNPTAPNAPTPSPSHSSTATMPAAGSGPAGGSGAPPAAPAASAGSSGGSSPSLAPVPATSGQPQPESLDRLVDSLPAPIRTLQYLVAILLAGFLVAGWLTSVRLRRR